MNPLKETGMFKTKWITAAICASFLVPVAGRADPFDPKMIPADAKWVAHIDFDAARNTKSFAAVRDEMMTNEDFRAKLDQIKDLTGLSIPDDVNDITLFGKASGDDAGVVIVHGKVDQAKTTESLGMAEQFDTKKHGKYDVYTWLDKDKNQTMWGAFHDGSTVIIGHSETNIEAALDAMDGKGESLKADSRLAEGAKAQVLIYVAAKDIPQLQGAGGKPNPIAASVDSAWISLSEKDDTANARADLRANSADNASNVRSLLEGLKGMLGVSASGENADLVAKAVVAADKTFATTQKDTDVLIDWPIPIDQLKAIIKAIGDKHAAGN
jgi:hypothetical protein